MARSYKSALPTWSTYTPHTSPLGVQGAINQENWWATKARQSIPLSGQGYRTHIAQSVNNMIKGTGTAAYAAAMPRHQPLLSAMTQAVGSGRARLDDRRQWMNRTREALEHHAPERMTEESEHEPSTPLNVRAERTEAETGPGRTAPSAVNPSDIATQRDAQAVVTSAGASALKSKKAGGSAMPQDQTERIMMPSGSTLTVRNRKRR
jgi:hypothetical protein